MLDVAKYVKLFLLKDMQWKNESWKSAFNVGGLAGEKARGAFARGCRDFRLKGESIVQPELRL